LYNTIESQDVWIFNTPLRSFDKANFEIGTVCCDPLIAGQAWLSGLEVINPCFSIQCCHCHLSGVRKRNDLDKKGQFYAVLPFNRLEAEYYPLYLSQKRWEKFMKIFYKKAEYEKYIKMDNKKVTCYVGQFK